jgi:hypothetical protein
MSDNKVKYVKYMLNGEEIESLVTEGEHRFVVIAAWTFCIAIIVIMIWALVEKVYRVHGF